MNNTRLRRLAAAIALAAACTTGVALAAGFQPSADTAWGAPATEDTGDSEDTTDDTAWGTPPPATPSPQPSTNDTAWG